MTYLELVKVCNDFEYMVDIVFQYNQKFYVVKDKNTKKVVVTFSKRELFDTEKDFFIMFWLELE